MLILKLIILAISAFLNWAGGFHWLFARRIIMPVILALFIAIKIKIFWLFFACGAPCAGLLSLGYGENSPLGRFFGGWIARGVWCLIVALGLSSALFLGHFLTLWLFLPYLLLNWLIGSIMVKNKANQTWQDIMEGLGFSSIILFI